LTPCFTCLRLAQDGSPLACSSHDAPQSPWGKLQSQSNQDPITASATTASLYRKQPHRQIRIQRGCSHNLWLWHKRLQQKCIILLFGMCLMSHSLSEACASCLPRRNSALPNGSHTTSRAKGPVTWEISGTSAASALKPQPSRNETRMMGIIGLPDEERAFVMSALTSPYRAGDRHAMGNAVWIQLHSVAECSYGV
jgi:hypothetical protein